MLTNWVSSFFTASLTKLFQLVRLKWMRYANYYEHDPRLPGV